MRLGKEPKGLIGSGIVITPPYEDEHYREELAEEGKMALYVDVEFDVLASTPFVTEEMLQTQPFKETNWTPHASGMHIDEMVAQELEAVWQGIVRPREVSEPDEISADGPYIEGSIKRVYVNSYERDAGARNRCIEHYGAACFICGCDFSKVYGDFAAGYIHVHHVVPLSKIGVDYVVNPINDLRPVCPNCHAAIHLTCPLMSPEELKNEIGRS